MSGIEIVGIPKAATAVAPARLSDEHRTALHAALQRLDANKGVILRTAELLSSALGSAAGYGLRRLRLPATLNSRMRGFVEALLRRGFDVAALGLQPGEAAKASHIRAIAALSGGVGGFVGIAGFLPDVTFTTLLIMRRVAAIAAQWGEDLSREEVRAACVLVFAFGSAELKEEPEFSYWTTRLVLQGRPLMLLISEAAATYGVRLSQKVALQAVPLVGAVGGAMVNTAFLDHYENLAQVHFAVRQLERLYGGEAVRAAADEWRAARAA